MLIYKHSGSRLLNAFWVLFKAASILLLPCLVGGLLLDSGVLSWTGITCLFVAAVAGVVLIVDDCYIVATRTAAEEGKVPLYSRTLRQAMDPARPLVRLAIYSDFLVLKARDTVVVRFAAVERVDARRRLLWPYLRFHMRDHEQPSIEIPCGDLKKVQRIVEERIKEEGST